MVGFPAKLLFLLVPAERIELPTFGLQNRCSTAELSRLRFDCLAAKAWTINARFWRISHEIALPRSIYPGV